jgi:very-short-patch-repair endonuclease
MDARSESVLESLTRVLLVLGGLLPVVQHEIRDANGAFVARVDFAWPDLRLVVEVDGFAFHADRAAYRRDRERLNELERLGWRVLRFTWEDVRHRPEHVLTLVRECLTQAAA